MKAVMRILPALLACTPINQFTATGPVYPPRPDDYQIEVLAQTPERPYVTLGVAEARGESLSDALPLILKRAREAGGDAILPVETTPVYMAVKEYRATVIRWTAQE